MISPLRISDWRDELNGLYCQRRCKPPALLVIAGVSLKDERNA
jgi:hypothetical protein